MATPSLSVTPRTPLQRALDIMNAAEPNTNEWWHDALPPVRNCPLTQSLWCHYIEWAASVHSHPTIIQFRSYVKLDDSYYYADRRDLCDAVYSMWMDHVMTIAPI